MKLALALAVVALVGAGVILLNSSGVRQPGGDIPLATWDGAPPDPLRITVFGTSLSANQGWTEELGRALSACLEVEVAMRVVAEPGAGTAWAESQVDRIMDPAPHILLMEFAINDADLLDGRDLEASRLAHGRIFDAVADTPRILLMSMSPAHGPRGWVRPFLSRHYAQYRDMARTHELGFVDLNARWLAASRDLRRFPDGLHPPKEAATPIIVPTLAESLAAMFGVACGGTSAPG